MKALRSSELIVPIVFKAQLKAEPVATFIPGDCLVQVTT
jgi:hypothetical protein